ncbi:hypothetical protein OUZ56_012609 [Daphnia magna]|uniref:Uncharacterized protein n=1 Tax=Daphnia magna TaxID=35525 RepID=A0ABQ9Z3I0_9CRUS|nr:hypothetical protein OUZ56_012609 [Daphnia magna]
MAGYESKCRHAKDCAIWYALVLTFPGTTCKLSNGHPGFCCLDIPYNGPDLYSAEVEKTGGRDEFTWRLIHHIFANDMANNVSHMPNMMQEYV